MSSSSSSSGGGQVRKVVLSTGNIMEMDELIRKAGQTTIEELRGSINTTLGSWGGLKDEGLTGEVLTIHRTVNSPKSASDNISGTKTTVKLFLSKNDSTQVEDAVKTVSSSLKLPCIDLLIITPPDVSDDTTVESLEPVWIALESAVERGQVLSLGLADVSYELFRDLYNWSKVKPTTLQVNLSSCCVVPQELSAFAQQHDVQVLTHSDAAEIIDEDIVLSITKRLGLKNAQLEWVARHRTIQQCFGLVQDKGYTLAITCSQ